MILHCAPPESNMFKDSLDVIAIGISLLALVSSLISQYRAKRVDKFRLREEYFREIHLWTNEVCNELSACLHVLKIDPSQMNGKFYEVRNKLLEKMSALIDRGRIFFPNIIGGDKYDKSFADNFEDSEKVTHGSHKESAFQGYRQEVLNILVDSYYFIKTLNYLKVNNEEEKRKLILKCKRQFISNMQEILDPRRRKNEFSKLIK